MNSAKHIVPDRFRSLEKLVFSGLAILTLLVLKHADVSSAWRGGLLIVCILSLICAILAKRFPWQGLVPEVRQLLLAWGVFVLVVVIASLAGATLELARTDLLRDFLLPATIPLLLATHIRQAKRWQALLLLLFAAALVVMARNLSQYVGEWSSLGGFSSNILLHRDYAGALVFSLPIMFYFALTLRQAWGRAICWGLAVLLLLMIIGTGARGSWLGGAVVIAVFLVYLRDRRFTWGVGIVAVSAAIIGVFLMPPELLANRIHQGFDTSLRTTGTWGPALEMIADRPVLGFGFGADVFHAEFNRRVAAAPHWSVRQSIGPHNFFLAIFFAAGAIGLISLLSVMLLTVGRLVGRLRKRVDGLVSRDAMAVAGVALVAMVAGSYFAVGMVENSNWHLFGYWLGLAVVWIQLNAEQGLGRPLAEGGN